MDSYRFGAGRYIQENNALDFCGEEIKRYGNKAYVIGGNTAIAVKKGCVQVLKNMDLRIAWKDFQDIQAYKR